MEKGVYDYSEVTRRLWVCHEALRRLGFQPEDIYISTHEEGGVEVIDCRLKTQGKQFVVNCGEGEDEKKIFAEWCQFVERLNSEKFPVKDLNKLMNEWPFPQPKSEFVTSLVAKGFTLPFTRN